MSDTVTIRRRHIALVIDRSGSMQSCRTDTEGGLATFLADQAKEFPDTTVTLHDFSCNMRVLYSNLPIADVPAYTLIPAGMTALLDAIGETITATKTAMKEYPKDERPDVIMVILTDGDENASTQYTLEKIKEMTEKRQAKGWTFVYLGANQDAITVAGRMGIQSNTSMTYGTHNTAETMSTASGMISRGTKGGGYDFTDDERTSAVQ